MITTLLNLPIVRHLIAATLILGIGFYLGNALFQNKLVEARKQADLANGKYEQLNTNYEVLSKRTDQLQEVVVKLAEKEHIKVENHVTDNKAKQGAILNLVPTTKATLELQKKDTLQPVKKRSFFKRIFG